MIRDNVVVGNPGIQTGATNPNVRLADIVNMAPEGQTRFERNVCVTGVNAPCPVINKPQ